MVDRRLLARKLASLRDALARIRERLPADEASFLVDRDAREIVVLNLFVALQELIDLAVHWIADEGWDVPEDYAGALRLLGERDVLPRALADRLVAVVGFRNLVAHRYGVLDWSRVFALARDELDDLEAFCRALAENEERRRDD